MATLTKAFRDSRRALVGLLVGMTLYLALLMAFYPSIVAQAAELDRLFQSMPKQLVGMFVSGDVEEFSVADPGQFLQVRYALFLVLIVGTMAIAQAFNAVTNAERDGTLDVMLSLPIARRRYLLGRMINTALMLVAVLVVSYFVLAAFALAVPEFDVALDDLALAVCAGFFPLATIAAFAYMLTALVPSSKSVAGAIAYVMLVGSYLVHSFAATIPELETVRPLLLFHYYDVAAIIREGLPLSNVLLLSAATAIYSAVALWAIDKKELSV